MRIVIGAMRRTVVTLSSSADAIAVNTENQRRIYDADQEHHAGQEPYGIEIDERESITLWHDMQQNEEDAAHDGNLRSMDSFRDDEGV